MSHLITNEQKLNDIIFADRNKAYGAYEIRSDYGYTVFKSISMMLIGVGSMVSVAVYMSNKNQPQPDLSGQIFLTDSIYVIPFNADEKKPEELPAEEQAHDQATTTDPADATHVEGTTISDSNFVATETSTTTSAVVISLVTSPGENSTSSVAGSGKVGGGIGSITGTDSNSVIEPYGVDSPPEFEGGLSALSRFVSRQLRYPESAYDQGKDGIVYVKFVVDENGKIGKLNLLNSIGYGMDDEALRVVGLIPKFKSPAKVKGVAVKSYYQLPIRFRFKN